MTVARPDSKRMLLRLPHSRQDYPTVTLVAELARLLGLELVATYLEDASLQGVTMLPDAREFRAGAWRQLSREQLAQDVALTAKEVARLFAESAERRGSTSSFSIARGSATDFGETHTGDIIAVIEPKNVMERVTHQFRQMVTAALSSASSVLLVPSRARGLAGPIIVVPGGSDTPCIRSALAAAKSAKERIIFVPGRVPRSALSPLLEKAEAAGIGVSVAEGAFQGADLLMPASANCSLLIMDRFGVDHQPTFSHVPILLV